MDQDRRRLYKALTARDARFDGVFFVGVTSTDIYCRPICPARTPKAANCRFFETPQAAEHAGFRPCLRCRPELAPGSAPVDDAQRIAHLIVQRLEEGRLDEKAGLEDIADQFELSSRQIRRIVQKELGVAADPAAADAPAAARQAAPDRDDAADHRGRVRQRLLQPAPVQRRLQRALRHAADAPAHEGAPTARPRSRIADVHAAARLSAALRLERHPRLPRRPRAERRRAGHRRRVRPHRAAGTGDGLDQGDARGEGARAAWSSSRTP